MWESQSPWRCLCANNFVCHVILLAPTRKRTWSRKIRNPGMQYLAIAKTADTSTCIDGKLTQQRRPTRREDRKQYTWHDDTRISGCIQWQMQRCAVEEAETIVNQRNATSFKHDVLHSVCQCKLLIWTWKRLNLFLDCESTSTLSCQPSVFRRWDSHGTAPKSWQTGWPMQRRSESWDNVSAVMFFNSAARHCCQSTLEISHYYRYSFVWTTEVT